MSTARCMFCNVELAPSQLDLPASQTREHVFARWIRNAVSNNRMTMYESTGSSTPTALRLVPLSNLVNARVCRRCNGGWMSALETRTEPLADRLVGGQS